MYIYIYIYTRTLTYIQHAFLCTYYDVSRVSLTRIHACGAGLAGRSFFFVTCHTWLKWI